MSRFFDLFRNIPAFHVESKLAKGTLVRGDLSGPGSFRVDGTVEGSVSAKGSVVIGEDGTIDGSVEARDVVVLGRVRGDVRATGHLEIGPRGKVLGDVSVQSLRMHKGGVFRGTSRMIATDAIGVRTNPLGILPEPMLVESEQPERPGGRTLPPPVGAVPPPPPPSAVRIAGPMESEERIVAPPLPTNDRVAVATKNAANG